MPVNKFSDIPVGHVVEVVWKEPDMSDDYYIRLSKDRIVAIETCWDGKWRECETNFPMNYIDGASVDIAEFIDHGPYQGSMKDFDSYITLEEEHEKLMKDDY